MTDCVCEYCSYWNRQTKDLTAVQVTDKLYTLAKETFPALTHEQWAKGMSGYGGTDADSAARVSWKYTCSRTVSGTPMYTLNGVSLGADSDWSVDDWRKVIDPLVKANAAKGGDAKGGEVAELLAEARN